ncbi:hypothetical protein TrVFT333_000554 [Trichoderma virens FT-333]|nr:hypothetical protein TrVFT333_000554 [Trichoderma virens FT-333]
MAPAAYNDRDGHLEAGLLRSTQGEKQTGHRHLTQQTQPRTKMIYFRRALLIIAVGFVLGLGVVTARPGVINCHNSKMAVAKAHGSNGELVEALQKASPDLLHRLLHAYLPERYQHGVFPSDREAIDAIHENDPSVASAIVQIAKRQDETPGNNNNTTLPGSSTTPPPASSTSSLPSTSTTPEQSTTSTPSSTEQTSTESTSSSESSSSTSESSTTESTSSTSAPASTTAGQTTTSEQSSTSAPSTTPSSTEPPSTTTSAPESTATTGTSTTKTEETTTAASSSESSPTTAPPTSTTSSGRSSSGIVSSFTDESVTASTTSPYLFYLFPPSLNFTTGINNGDRDHYCTSSQAPETTITSGSKTTSAPVLHTFTRTLPNGGTTTLTSTSWVAVVPTDQAEGSKSPDLQNAASLPRGEVMLPAAIGLLVGAVLMV